MGIASELTKGFTIGLALIVAIGPQNMFVISQGVKRRYVFMTALVCGLIDAVLVAMGVFGLAKILAYHSAWTLIIRWLGIGFLTVYAGYALRGIFYPTVLKDESVSSAKRERLQVISILLGLGFLNPHAYLDAVFLVGNLALHEPPGERHWFALGVILASFVWFFALAYGAKLLSPLFKKSIAWRFLNGITCTVMVVVALNLALMH